MSEPSRPDVIAVDIRLEEELEATHAFLDAFRAVLGA